MIKKASKSVFMIAVLLILAVAVSMSIAAGGPPLKENSCGVCHKDFKEILPKDHPNTGAIVQLCLTCHTDPARTGPTKFSDKIHAVHRDGKAKLECSACHAL